MAKNLLGSGSSGRLSTGGDKLTDLSIPNQVPGMPWVDPARWETQKRAGLTGKMLHDELQKSKGTGIKV